MSLIVVGSVALDSVKTPFGEARHELGGSATYFATAASFFTDVRMVAVVGGDFPPEHLDALRKRGIDLAGLEIKKEGKTFRWQGEYGLQLNDAKTLNTELNVLQSFCPQLPAAYADARYLFLANVDPDAQWDLYRQVAAPHHVALDTMNFWIAGSRDRLLKILRAVNIVMINEGEARALSGEWNILKAAQTILSWGPATLVIKRGEYGALLFHHGTVFSIPAYPTESVMDPTGAGDSFAGGFMGFLAARDDTDDKTIRRAMIYGAVMASFCVETFGLNRLLNITSDDIEKRYAAFWDLTRYV